MSLKNISTFSPSNCEATSIKYLELKLISKLIDGKFPNYIQVIPKNNQKKLEIDLKLFLNSVDRVASVSLDKKDGVKFNF